jgi:hypothetical protein
MSQMIENSDRGITVNKGVAWTIVTGLVAGGIWLGAELAGTKAALVNLNAMLVDQQREGRIRNDALDLRVRTLETTRATDASEIVALRRDLSDFRQELRAVAALLRGQRP